MQLVKPAVKAFKLRAPKKSEDLMLPPEKTDDPSPASYNFSVQHKRLFDKSISFSFCKQKPNGKWRPAALLTFGDV